MNADAFRHFFDYHFTENQKIWDNHIKPLSLEQFRQSMDYSHGSVRDQIVHLMSVDEAWFCGIRGADFPESFPDSVVDDREAIRAYWDAVEKTIRGYLELLQDEMLLTKPIDDEEDKDLILWQVLLHIVNHGTDHRAQLLRFLNDLGVETESQDYIFYVYQNL